MYFQVSKKYVSKETAAKIHEKAQPFIKWLKEAESESESEDEDGIEVDFDTRAHVSRDDVSNINLPLEPFDTAINQLRQRQAELRRQRQQQRRQ